LWIVNALDLYLLGRRLMKLGEGAMRPPGAPPVPTGVRLIVTDIAEHPGSPIGEIARRTGLPQSHVSHSVARLRERGAVETESDPKDGRRTLVRLSQTISASAARHGAARIDARLAEAARLDDPSEVVATLEALLAGFRRDADEARE
jgi:DNA-binding MarR family transcriptional regulator